MNARNPNAARHEKHECVEQPPAVAVRAESLRLLKSKLRASGKDRRTSNQRAEANRVKAVPSRLACANQLEEGPEARNLLAPMAIEPAVPVPLQQPHRAKPSTTPGELVQASTVRGYTPSEVPGQLPVTSTAQVGCNQSHGDVGQELQTLELKQAREVHGRLASGKMTPKSYTKTVIEWSCTTCQRECIPVREESRCLCGHRYKEHPSRVEDPRVKSPAGFRAFACTSTKCACKAFFYVVAEGAWILRCRCKHKHTDHDAAGKPHACKKPRCDCLGFDRPQSDAHFYRILFMAWPNSTFHPRCCRNKLHESPLDSTLYDGFSPWVCNCDHPWGAHRQHRVVKRFDPLRLLQGQCDVQELNAVHRTDLLATPLNLRL